MKHTISILLCLGQVVAAGRGLNVRGEIETECYALNNVNEQDSTFNSYGGCIEQCRGAGASQVVFAVRGSGCVCLDSLPTDDKRADASKCDEPCPGYAKDMCGGGREYYSVGAVGASYFDSSNTTDTTATSIATATSTSAATGTVAPSSVPANSTSSDTPPSSSSAQSGSASASPTIESSNAAAPGTGSSVTFVSSTVYALAVVVALV